MSEGTQPSHLAQQRLSCVKNNFIADGGVFSLPSSPRHLTGRKSIFSSEPKSQRSMSSPRMTASREDIRSPQTKRQNSQRNLLNCKPPPTLPPRVTSRKVKSAAPRGQRRGDRGPCEYEELPKLPLPPLADILTQYLDNVRPVVSNANYEGTKKLVDEFGAPAGVGEQVHAMILDKREKEDNWALDWWLQDMYLNYRLPLPVNSNPGMVFPRMQFNTATEMLSFACRVVMGFVHLKKDLDEHSLPQDRAATRETGQPLCMAQYFRLLTTYRQPGRVQDKQVSTGLDPKEAEHIMVGRKGYWYSIPVKTGGKWRSLEDIFSSLMDVWEHVENSQAVSDRDRVAYLTSSDRDKWAENFLILNNNKTNSANLQMIVNSLLLVCLDSETQNCSDTNRSMKDCFRQMLTGAGSRYNGSNRWFDKTVQLVLTMDGVCGLCYEHSPSEGIAVVQFLEGVIRDMEGKGTQPIGYHPDSAQYSRLEWQVDSDMQDRIDVARQELDLLDSDNDLEVFNFSTYGKEFIKSCRCSPDAWLQMSLQLTMFKLTGNIVPTYESASTRRFRLGRVDSIRASHPEAVAWCSIMVATDKRKEEKRKMFDLAMRKQTQVMVDNILGRGLDIPLLGLREAAKEGAMVGRWEMQEMFRDESYTKINSFTLSTSQVPVGLSPSFMGYGAVVPDGYGVSYNPYPDSVIFCICSFHSCPGTDSRQFAATLEESLKDLREMFIK